MVVMEMYTDRPTLTDALNDMDWDVRKYVKIKTTSTRNENRAQVILGSNAPGRCGHEVSWRNRRLSTPQRPNGTQAGRT
jgi:hypothetical protein